MKSIILFTVACLIIAVGNAHSSIIPQSLSSTENLVDIPNSDRGLSDVSVDKVVEKNTINVTYTESDSIFFNPERGFYSHANPFTLDNLKNIAERGISIVMNSYSMPYYRDKLLSQTLLDSIENNLKNVREAGLKAYLQFRYTTNVNNKPWDAPEELTIKHIEQLKPIFHKYSDVIYVLKAGFVGVWGEWYYTDHYNYLPNKDEYGPRRRVLDALLDALPESRMIATRTPAAKLYSFNIEVSDTVTLQTAYDGSDLSRIAFHNDCFLADEDDTGTFGGDQSFRKYWASDTKYLAMGGETCGLSTFSECNNAIKDMATYHWSFLNESYHRGVLKDWEVTGCLDEITRRLGYRFVLIDGKFQDQAERGEEFKMSLNLKNVGFAAPFNPRGAEIVFVSKNSKEEHKFKLAEDPRYWFPEEKINISATIVIPEDMTAGDYDVYLHLPDPEPNLYGNIRYSIRLANKDVWDYDKGYNKIYSLKVNE